MGSADSEIVGDDVGSEFERCAMLEIDLSLEDELGLGEQKT